MFKTMFQFGSKFFKIHACPPINESEVFAKNRNNSSGIIFRVFDMTYKYQYLYEKIPIFKNCIFVFLTRTVLVNNVNPFFEILQIQFYCLHISIKRETTMSILFLYFRLWSLYALYLKINATRTLLCTAIQCNAIDFNATKYKPIQYNV